MIERYEQSEVSAIFSDENKTRLWDETEIAVMEAYAESGEWPASDAKKVRQILLNHPTDLKWWKKREESLKHDLNAYLEERLRHIPVELQHLLHKDLTSYDTEESAFVRMLAAATKLVLAALDEIEKALGNQAKQHRFTLLVGRTHGQPAELQTHGKRCITWLQQLRTDRRAVELAGGSLRYSKISGAVGNWGQLHPEVERLALERLGLEPFCGATQVMPRELYKPLADALASVVLTLDKIGLDIRLNARPPYPLYQEPFGKRQKGSSAMPHKKNTIRTEQLEGMARMASSYAAGIAQNIRTWEERAIEQSCIERVFWPDLFHVTLYSLRSLTNVLKGLVIHRHNMNIEIVMGRGCHATAGAKEVLKALIAPYGLKAEDAYRIVQLAAFNLFEEDVPKLAWADSYEEAEQQLAEFAAAWQPVGQPATLEQHVLSASLRPSPQLDASPWKIKQWNRTLKRVFAEEQACIEWRESFRPRNILRHEARLFEELRLT
jgi:adenylosuccinate lyase